jgi:hypothetical protein
MILPKDYTGNLTRPRDKTTFGGCPRGGQFVVRCAAAGAAERAAPHLIESLAATVDLASRALAPFIPRLIIHVRAELARLEFNIALGYRNVEEDKTQERADRAREFLAKLEAIPRVPVCASCGGPLCG